MAYIERGWSVVPLHDVTGGRCSCGSADPKHDPGQGGKHPVGGGWQNAGLRTAAAVVDAWARRPGANIGIVTGRASGIWVLDVDPDHAGDKQLAALVAAYGVLPETYAVRTGSGGAHYYWQMPDFDFTTSRGLLPLGLDVRGNRGQVVAPPSYTLKGAYTVALEAPVVAAPGWLLAMIKPPERVEHDAGAWGGADAFGVVAGGGAEMERGPGYARAAVGALLAQLAGAQPGERNNTAYRVARRLAELVASPWSGLDPAAVHLAYLAAAEHCDAIDGGFPQSEAEDVLKKAARDGGGRGVDLPAADHLGTLVSWAPPDFGPAAAPEPGEAAAQEEAAPGAVPVADPLFEDAVRFEMGRQMVRDEARRRVAETSSPTLPVRFLRGAELGAIPAPVPLVDGWLYRDTLARIIGPSGQGKSFVALELAACVATGRAWHGNAVTAGPVVYMAAEGAPGISARLEAWCVRMGLDPEDRAGVIVIPEAVQSSERRWALLTRQVAELAPAMVVLDTQARITEGVNENDAGEMGVAIGAWERLRAATGACVVLVHHRGLTGAHGRGSTAVKGAMTTEIDVSKTGLNLLVKAVKQKDAPEAPDLRLTMNMLRDSVVLLADNEMASESAGPFMNPTVVAPTPRQRAAVALAQALMDAAASGLTKAEARHNARVALGWKSTDDQHRQTLTRGWADLIGLGRIAKASGREAYYFIECGGAPILAANPGKVVQGGPETYQPEH